jgi:hypothetical protein
LPVQLDAILAVESSILTRPDRLHLLQILAIDGLCSLTGLFQAEPHLVSALQSLLRQRLVKIVRPALKPTGYSRQVIPTDVAALTAAGRLEAQRSLGRPAVPASLDHEVEHRLGVAELRSRLHIPPDAWTSAAELQAPRFARGSSPVVRAFPDALADIRGVRLALEFDHGRYTAVQIRGKLQAFRHLANAAIWAAPTDRRVRWLQGLGCERTLVVPLPLGVWQVPIDANEAKSGAGDPQGS